MKRPELVRLARLSEIAELKADRAIQDLAQAISERDRIATSIDTLDRDVSAVLAETADPFSQPIALGYANLRRTHRQELLAELARAELKRKAVLKVAQKEEGRRIAISNLKDQAS